MSERNTYRPGAVKRFTVQITVPIYEKIHEGHIEQNRNPLHNILRIVEKYNNFLKQENKTKPQMKENHNTPGDSAENNCVVMKLI